MTITRLISCGNTPNFNKPGYHWRINYFHHAIILITLTYRFIFRDELKMNDVFEQ